MLIPYKVRTLANRLFRPRVFDRALRQLARECCLPSFKPDNVLQELVYGWGNEAWSADVEYLKDCLTFALHADSAILECGSGLSSIVLGIVGQQRGVPVISLEHLPEWARKVQRCIDRAGITSVSVITAPLRSYGGYDWYDVDALARSWPDFDLVVCDGPPSSTTGGRYGLAPVMRDRLRAGCVILLDDAERAEEREIAGRWAAELQAHAELVDRPKPYFRITLPSA